MGEIFRAVQTSIAAAERDFDAIAPDRQARLESLGRFIARGPQAAITFICTHNSRRSHMAQLWAATGAAWYGVEGVSVFSGGTEATAFDPRAVAAMRRAGFQIDEPGGANPRYSVRYSARAPIIECFSKRYDDPDNPRTGFAAVMTCSSADEACPVVHGADFRVAIPYDDPKLADGKPDEKAVYDHRCRQIAAEMLYLMSRVSG